MAVHEANLGSMYKNRADIAETANDLDRCMANLELALPHLREAIRILRANNRVDTADKLNGSVAEIEKDIRQIGIARAVAAVTAAATTG